MQKYVPTSNHSEIECNWLKDGEQPIIDDAAKVGDVAEDLPAYENDTD